MFQYTANILLKKAEIDELTKRLDFQRENTKEMLHKGHLRAFESVDYFWGYVIRDENLSRDVVRSVAYEKNEYIDSFDSTEQYLLYELGAIVLSTGRVVYTYGNFSGAHPTK